MTPVAVGFYDDLLAARADAVVGEAVELLVHGDPTIVVGGRRYQVLALLLTYYSVGLAYFPLAMHEGRKTTEQERQASAPAAKPKEAPEPAVKPARSDAFLALGVLLLFCVALPVVAVVGSLPSGLITAFIIFIGMRQAWRMTAALPIEVTGPYRLGAHPAVS